jgi:ankyrin repeat protein
MQAAAPVAAQLPPPDLVAAVSKAASKGEAFQLAQLMTGAEDRAALAMTRDARGRLALHGAAAKGRLPCLEMLLMAGREEEQVTAADSKGGTPLMLACNGGHAGCVDKLLNQPEPLVRAQLLAADRQGGIALMFACGTGQAGCVKLLLGHQSHVKQQLQAVTTQGDTALMIACREGHEACVKLLLAAGFTEAQCKATDR